MAFRILATASGSTMPSAFTRMPRSAPMASAVRMVSEVCAGPIDTATISVALPASLRRIASSTAISSNGFIDILILASSTPEPAGLTRILTLKSTTRLPGTRIFMIPIPGGRLKSRGRKLMAAPLACQRLCCGAKGSLSILPRRPEHIPRALVIGIAAGDEQIIRQPVDVFERRRRNTLTRLVLELDHDALGAPADRAGQMHIGRGWAAARKNE